MSSSPVESEIVKEGLNSRATGRYRVAVLWTGLSGYLAACLRELQANNVELFVAHANVAHNAPFSSDQFNFFDYRHVWRQAPNLVELHNAISQFNPNAIVVAGWHVAAYRSILKTYRNRVPRILCMDNQWRATPKQHLGVLLSRFHVRPLCDAVWVPGERQFSFARRLGFSASSVLRGMYSCDFDNFSMAYCQRLMDETCDCRGFIFTGRFVKEKGIETLVDAYCKYRALVSEPWPLICCGTGPLESKLRTVRGIVVKGFVQPQDLPRVFGQAGCFVLPSVFEPWGVVVHEAAAAGLPLICSSAVGSTVHLVQDGYNGFIFEAGDTRKLAQLLLRIGSLNWEARRKMGQASNFLAQQFTPKRWATYLLERFEIIADDIIHNSATS